MSALSFLGLARKAGRVEIGEEYIAMAARAGKAKLIATASDAGKNTLTRAENAARCPIAALPFTGEELGAALGKGAVSALAITDIHFAHAFAEKLSGERPGFEDIRAALAEKDEKAMERQEEEKRHRRNVQKGKKKK